MSGVKSLGSRDPWLWTSSWNLVGLLCMRDVVTLSMMPSTGCCLAAFGKEMSDRSSPVDNILARALEHSVPTI